MLVLKSGTATENDKIAALNDIRTIFQATTPTAIETTETLQTINDYCLAPATIGTILKETSASTVQIVFHKASSSDLDIVFDSLINILNVKGGDISLKRCCVYTLNCAFNQVSPGGTNLASTKHQFHQIIGALETTIQSIGFNSMEELGLGQAVLACLEEVIKNDRFGQLCSNADVKKILDILEYGSDYNAQMGWTWQNYVQGNDYAIASTVKSLFSANNLDMIQIDDVNKYVNLLTLVAGRNEALFAMCMSPILNTCIMQPSLFDHPALNKLFGIDSSTAQQMKDNSPDWIGDNPSDWADLEHSLKARDFAMICKIAVEHPNEPIIKTIFETTNITYFGQFTQKQLEHFYYDKDTPTGKPLFFGVLTTHKRGVDFTEQFRGDNINNNFDVRFIQPGTTPKLLNLLEQTADRLGVKSKDIDPSGPKFKVFVMLAHGIPQAGTLKESGPWWDMPRYFNSTDTQEITKIGKYFDNARAYFEECSPAGDWHENAYGFYPYNIAETLGEYAGMKVWGAQGVINRLSATYGMDGLDYTVLNVEYMCIDKIPRNSYDYVNTGELSLSTLSATKAGEGVDLFWSAQDLPITVGYDVERSVDGALFERVGLVEANKTGTYSFTDASPLAEGANVYYKIKQRNATPHGTDGASMDYTFAFSKAIKMVEIISPPNLSQAGFEFTFGPNPFSSAATIGFSLPKDCHLKIALYDISGKEVAKLVDEKHAVGKDEVQIDANSLSLAPGIYLCNMEIDGSVVQSKKIIRVK
ncbi:MAG: T9SS type A sorting domain-containing protein [Candidatus Micrarchaeota archaeon]|nr:T9SS type A sorting domain-containing protein [Candidatus Micrarchaeota archaeon]